MAFAGATQSTDDAPGTATPVPVRGRHRKGGPLPAPAPDASAPRTAGPPASAGLESANEFESANENRALGKHGVARREVGTPELTVAEIEEVDRLAASMLAELAASERADLGPLADPQMSRGRKVGLMVGGAVGICAFLLAVFAILGTAL